VSDERDPSERDTEPPRPITLEEVEDKLIALSEALHSPDGVAARRHREVMHALETLSDGVLELTQRVSATEEWQRKRDAERELGLNGNGHGPT